MNSLWMARQEAGLRQKSVARLLGHKSASAISEYESGRLMPSLSTALKLCEIYKRDIKDLYPELYATVLSQLQAVSNRS